MKDPVVQSLRRWAATPGILAFAAMPRLRARPLRAYAALRAIDRIHRSPSGVWVLTGHREVAAALRNPMLGTDESKMDLGTLRLGPLRRLLDEPTRRALEEGGPAPVESASLAGELMRRLMLFRDPPDHTRLRSLVNKAFTPRSVSSLEGRIEEIVEKQVDDLWTSPHPDFMEKFAYPVPALIICELMGVPLEDHVFIARHAPALGARLDPSPMRGAALMADADRAVAELSEYLTGVIARKRAEPADDLLSRLVAVENEGRGLDHDELVAMVILLLIAGHETTANLLGNGLVALLSHPQEWARFRSDHELDATAVDELMRFDGPIQMTERIALDDVEVGDRTIPKGSIVILCLAAANRDPAAFDRPSALALGRDPNPHVGFGGGTHFCVGAPLARLEARVALRAIAKRCPGIRICTDRLDWRPGFTIRGLRRLPVAPS